MKLLSIQSNRITVIEGLDELENLEEFYISNNGIREIQGLQRNVKLVTLDLASNFIEHVGNVSHLVNLQEFWFNDNKLADWNDIEQLSHAKQLDTVYFEGNPIARDSGYRRKIKLALPSLTQIDATMS